MVTAPQVIEDGSSYSGRSEGAEGESACGLEIVDSVHQADSSCTDELIELGVRRALPQDLPRHMVNQAKMFREELLSGSVVAAVLVGGPKCVVHALHHHPRFDAVRHGL